MNFMLNHDAGPDGTSLRGYFTASYADLERVFGPAQSSDGYKVSSEWTFESDAGDVFTLYDYKDTSLYDQDLPSVEEFRKLPEYEWHIGAARGADIGQFKAWLRKQLAK